MPSYVDPYKMHGRSPGSNHSTSPRQRNRDRTQALSLLTSGTHVVYAVQLPQGIIKIGCTADLAQRRYKFGRDCEVLGFMPGDFEDEAAIHAALRPHLAQGEEYYHRTREVVEVVNRMRRHFDLEPVA